MTEKPTLGKVITGQRYQISESMVITFEEVQQEADRRNLDCRKCSDYHFQVYGGWMNSHVNIWSPEGWRLWCASDGERKREGGVCEAIEALIEATSYHKQERARTRTEQRQSTIDQNFFGPLAAELRGNEAKIETQTTKLELPLELYEIAETLAQAATALIDADARHVGRIPLEVLACIGCLRGVVKRYHKFTTKEKSDGNPRRRAD